MKFVYDIFIVKLYIKKPIKELPSWEAHELAMTNATSKSSDGGITFYTDSERDWGVLHDGIGYWYACVSESDKNWFVNDIMKRLSKFDWFDKIEVVKIKNTEFENYKKKL